MVRNTEYLEEIDSKRSEIAEGIEIYLEDIDSGKIDSRMVRNLFGR